MEGNLYMTEVAQINVALMIHYAGLDKNVNEGWPAFEKVLKEYNKDYEAFIYPDVNHGFYNYSTPRYDEAAAVLSRNRTIIFFNNKLK